MTSPVDEAAVAAVIKRQRFLQDTAQYEKARAEFHPDPGQTYLKVTWYEGDVDGFYDGWRHRKLNEQEIIINHSIDPVYIQVKGDRAISDSALNMMRAFDHDGDEYELWSRARSLNRYAKVDGEWKILSFETIYLRDKITSTSPVPPTNPLVIDESAGKDIPKAYRHLAWLVNRGGHKVSPHEAHQGDLDRVRRMVDEHQNYLEGGDWTPSKNTFYRPAKNGMKIEP